LQRWQKNCQTVDEEYAARVKVRNQEIVALAETLDILTGDDARELFAKSVGTSFLQVDASVSMQDRRAQKAMDRLMKVAKKQNNWILLSLAVRTRLDAFTKVKEAMDKLMAELKKQQSDEVAKYDQCNKEIDETEDSIKVANNKKDDLDDAHKDLTNQLTTLSDEIKTLQQEVYDMEVSLKKAGIDRKAANQLFQSSVADQRATVKILNMAMNRLKDFYTPGAAFVAVKSHQPVPGARAAPPPPKPAGYEKSEGAGGVLQLLMTIISEAESEERNLELDENQEQKIYAEFVQEATTSIDASKTSIAEKEKQTAEAESAKSATEESQLSNDAELQNLDGLLMGLHADCDFVIKYYDIRQKTRQEEMDAIEEAYAILSGANFGL